MEQAYQFFNSGKYKQALNSLSTNPSNIDSYEPNLYICEYMSNRCQQSALNTLKKLNDIIARKYKRQGNRNDPQTENIIKLNIAILMILQGKRDNALIILKEIYHHRHCFIQFIQTRIFLLLLQLNVTLKNSFEVLALYRYYLLKPTQPKAPHQQWMSIILHEHGKTYYVVREEFNFIVNVYINQALMQIGAPLNSLTSIEDDDRYKQDLLVRIKRRKNGVSKYYQINLIMINRFLQAQKQFYSKNYQRCLSLMNFVNMSEEFDQMPTTKIITNIINGFATSNTGIVHFIYEKPFIALSYFTKAKTLLAKACTGVQDRELHIISLNYGNYLESIAYNQALCLLGYKPKEAFQYFDSLRKSNLMSKTYKYWYRVAQSILDYYHDLNTPQDQKKGLLQLALSALTNCLTCLDNSKLQTFEQIKNISKGIEIQDDEIQTIIMRCKAQIQRFRYSVYALMCYTCLGLQLYRKVVVIGKKALEDHKMDSINRLNIMYYVIQAQLCLGKSNYDLQSYIGGVQQQIHQHFTTPLKVVYSAKGVETYDSVDYETLFYYQLFSMFIGQANYGEALKSFEFIRAKLPTKITEYLSDAVKYLHLKFNFDKKYVYPFVKSK